MRPTIKELTLSSVQTALNVLADEVTRLGRLGDSQTWEPKYLRLPDVDTVINPGLGVLAWDRAAAGIVRWNGDRWEQVT